MSKKSSAPFWKKYHRKAPWWWGEVLGYDQPCECSCGHEHESPDARAWKAMLSHLNTRQRRQLMVERAFTVRGKTRRWRINYDGRVEVWRTVKEGHEYPYPLRGWDDEVCIVLDKYGGAYDGYDGAFPAGDIILAAKLAIELDDERFYKVGVSHEEDYWKERKPPKKKKKKPAARKYIRPRPRRRSGRR